MMEEKDNGNKNIIKNKKENERRNEIGNGNRNKDASLIQLFWSMLIISAFTFGGGFVIIGMMRKKFCDELHWVSDEEVLDMTAIAQSAPGALAVNSAVIFGYRIKGFKGALISAIATVIPPIVIISIITMIYDSFSANLYVQTALRVMRAGVGAVITDRGDRPGFQCHSVERHSEYCSDGSRIHRLLVLRRWCSDHHSAVYRLRSCKKRD